MLWRLILKLTFKMSLPLFGILGVLTYGHYLQGGDPGAVWRSLGGGIGTKLTSMFDDARQGVTGLGDSMGEVAGGVTSLDGAPSNTQTQVFTWTDAQGQTHFSQSAPLGHEATSMVIDSSTNVLVGFSESHRPAPPVPDTHESGVQGIGDPFGEGAGEDGAAPPPMPGVAGLVSSGRSEGNPAQGVDVEALMKVLQAR